MKSFCHTLRHTESVTKVHLANLGPCYTRFASLLNVQSRALLGRTYIAVKVGALFFGGKSAGSLMPFDAVNNSETRRLDCAEY